MQFSNFSIWLSSTLYYVLLFNNGVWAGVAWTSFYIQSVSLLCIVLPLLYVNMGSVTLDACF